LAFKFLPKFWVPSLGLTGPTGVQVFFPYLNGGRNMDEPGEGDAPMVRNEYLGQWRRSVEKHTQVRAMPSAQATGGRGLGGTRNGVSPIPHRVGRVAGSPGSRGAKK
jgi:hypothetical protein